MPTSTDLKRPKTARARSALAKKSAKWIENPKRTLLVESGKVSGLVKQVLSEIHIVKKAHSVRLTKKNENVKPFEAGGEVSLEFLCQKNDCSLFVNGSSSKKRPHNLIWGRLYDFHLYDMVELGVETFKSMKEFGSAGTGSTAGSKPCLSFLGEGFEKIPELKLVKNIFLDMFRGAVTDELSLKGIDRMIVIAEAEGKVYFRQYIIKFKKSGTRVPRVELEEMGPSITFGTRRHRVPDHGLAKEACRPPPRAKKEKNIKRDELGETYGHVHIPKQEVDTIATVKMKGLKRERREKAEEKAKSSAEADGGDVPKKTPPQKKARVDPTE